MSRIYIKPDHHPFDPIIHAISEILHSESHGTPHRLLMNNRLDGSLLTNNNHALPPGDRYIKSLLGKIFSTNRYWVTATDMVFIRTR